MYSILPLLAASDLAGRQQGDRMERSRDNPEALPAAGVDMFHMHLSTARFIGIASKKCA